MGCGSVQRRSLRSSCTAVRTPLGDLPTFAPRRQVNAVMSSSAAAPYVDELRKLYDPSTLPDLMISLYEVLMQLVSASDELRDIMSRLDTHFDAGLLPR